MKDIFPSEGPALNARAVSPSHFLSHERSGADQRLYGPEGDAKKVSFWCCLFSNKYLVKECSTFGVLSNVLASLEVGFTS